MQDYLFPPEPEKRPKSLAMLLGESATVKEDASEEVVLAELVAATDGSSLGNPGPGGWAWYVDEQRWGAGGEAHTTNNIMELMAVSELLAHSDPKQPLRILADSQYVINCLTKWVHGWRRRGWKTSNGGEVANRELIEAISKAMAGRKIVFEWVRGHEGHALNEAADKRARDAAMLIQAKGGRQ